MKIDKQHVSIFLSFATLVILIVVLVRQDKSENFKVGINNPDLISKIMKNETGIGSIGNVCKGRDVHSENKVTITTDMAPSVDCVTRLAAYETKNYYRSGNMFNRNSTTNDNMMMKYCCGDKTIKPLYNLPTNSVPVDIKIPVPPMPKISKNVSQAEIDALRF